MKPEKLQDALGMIGEDLIDENNLKHKKPKHTKIKWAAVIAAVLCVTLTLGIVLRPKKPEIYNNGTDSHNSNIGIVLNPDPSDVYLYNGTLAMALYPKSPAYPSENELADSAYSDDSWYQFYQEMDAELESLDIDLNEFYKKTCTAFFKNCENENLLYSPINLYMALAIMAEISDGESRAQLLELTDTETIEDLRRNAKALWKACYKNDGLSSTVLANSLWLDNKYTYNQSTLDTLAEYYYASSFSGESGSEEFNKTLQKWLNDQTNGFMEDKVNEISIPPEAVLTLASTIYFYAKWSEEFEPEDTKKNIFHSAAGDIECDFMNSSKADNYFWAENFSAVKKHMNENGTMYFILPDEGVSTEEVLAGEELYTFLNTGDLWENREHLIVNMSVPKFDVSSKEYLEESLKGLGVTDIFSNNSSNFANLTDDTEGFAAYIEHSVRVKIDEEGCEAAAYTIILNAGASRPPEKEVDFILDRPFIFIITSDAGIPLYTGVVNNP